MTIRFISLIFLVVWTGSGLQAQWAPFSNGNTDGTVIELTWFENELYAGGFFTQINGDPAQSVAKWNGNNWEEVAGGLDDGVHSLNVIDSVLYAVRYEFGVDSNWVYYLDDSTWKKLGTGFYLSGANTGQFYTPTLFDVVEYNGELVVCGEFDQNGDSTILGIARWDGSQWHSLGSGLTTPFFGQVINPHQMEVFNGNLYVCGNFQQAGGVQVNGVAVWNGSTWSALGDGFNSTVYALGVYNNELYAGGDFTASGTTSLGTIGKWNGSAWVSPGFAFDYVNSQGYLFVHTIRELGGRLYAMGGFNRCIPNGQPALTAGSVIAFDGQNLDMLAGGADNDVESMTEFAGQILFGGFFATVGNGVSASKLALYDSTMVNLAPVSNVGTGIRSYPNPVHQYLQLEGVEEGTAYEIFDLTGIRLSAGTYQGRLDLEAYPAGTYLIQVSEIGRRAPTPLLIQKQ